MHLVGWEEVCKPKKLGGLGITKIRDMNKALLSKWLWRFGIERDSLWRQVVAEKYGIYNDYETKTTSLPYGCGCWKAILKSLEVYKRKIKVEIGSTGQEQKLDLGKTGGAHPIR